MRVARNSPVEHGYRRSNSHCPDDCQPCKTSFARYHRHRRGTCRSDCEWCGGVQRAIWHIVPATEAAIRAALAEGRPFSVICGEAQ